MSSITFLGCSLSQFQPNSDSTKRDNYVINVKYCPNGTKLVSLSNDNIIRFFPQVVEPASEDILPDLCVNLGGSGGANSCYDLCWHPNSEIVATSSKRNSVLLWNANTGQNCCSYPIKNHVDEITGPHSLQFDVSGEYLFCGFDKTLKIVNVDKPNQTPTVRHLKNHQSPQSGIISSIAINQQMYSLASYSGHIGLYDCKTGMQVALIDGGHNNRGITQVQFTMQDNLLVSAARKDTSLCVWDLRQISIPLAESFGRNAMTNQRIRFDIHNNLIFSGSLDGKILIYDLIHIQLKALNDNVQQSASGTSGVGMIPAHDDCCNSVSCMPSPPTTTTTSSSNDDVIFIVSGSGQRRYTNTVMATEDSSDESDDASDYGENELAKNCGNSVKKKAENCLKFWKIHK